MPEKTGKNLIKGTMVLILGNVIVKIIGAFFKLPLANIIGADGMGLYNASFIVYDIFLVIATAGFPLAISKMVARSSALGKDSEALKIFTVSRRFFLVLGIVCAAVMALGAKLFSQLIGNTRAYYSILILAPAVIFVALMSSYRGYYQGTNDMIPTTISQVTEAICRLVVGLSVSWYLKQAGFPMEIVTVGALAGITFGEFSSTFTLGAIHRFRMKKSKIKKKCSTPSLHIIKTMFMTAVPIAVSTMIISVINMLDNSIVMHRLQDIGYCEKEANILYGCLNMAFTVYSLPITIVSAVSTSVFPILSYSYACKDYHRVSRASQASLKISMIAGTASAALFLSLSYPIINLLYFNQPRDAAIAAPLLMMLGPSAITITMSMLTTTILYSIDKLLAPSKSMIIGGVICLGLNYILTGIFGIYAQPIGIFICYAITTLINILEIRKNKKIKLSFKNMFYKPLIPAAVMAITGAVTFRLTNPSLGLLKASGLSIVFCLIVYFLVLLLNNCIEKEDLMILPKGEKLIRFFSKLHLIK